MAVLLLCGCTKSDPTGGITVMSNGARRYQIPATRLPFVNGEIAEVEFQGQRRLVSATWCGADARGRLYFFNPDSGQSDERQLPEGIPGAYMLKTAADGRLYIGCGNGDLVRHDPTSDAFTVLVTGALHSITWGGCIAGNHVIWSASPGECAIYDIRADKLLQVFKPLDTDTPTAIYAHNIVAAPDGRAVAFVNVPQTRMVLIDPSARTAKSVTPEEMKGAAWTTQAAFTDDKTIVAFVRSEPSTALIIDYPSLRVAASIPAPESPVPTNARPCVIDGNVYSFLGAAGSLYRLDPKQRQWTLIRKDWLQGDLGVMGKWKANTAVCLSTEGVVHTFNTESGAQSTMQIDAWGPLEAHAFCVIPEAGVIMGAPFINRRFWRIDLATGKGRDLGRGQPGSGQINQIVWDPVRKKVLMSSYTSAALSEYDPAKAGQWPDNPRLVNETKTDGLLRPRDLAFDGRYAWMAASPEYGTLGGGLVRFDPQTNDKRVWKNIVPAQTINGLALDPERRRLFFSSEIHADSNSCPPTAKNAEIVLFDTEKLQIVRRRVIDGEEAVRVLCRPVPGQVLAAGDKALYRWNTDNDTLDDLGPLPGLQEIMTDVRGNLWASAKGGIGRLTFPDGKAQVDILIPEPRRIRFFRIVEDTIWYPAGTEVFAVPIGSLPRAAP